METLEFTGIGSALVLMIVQYLKNQNTWTSRGKAFAMLIISVIMAIGAVAVRAVTDGVDLANPDVLIHQFVLIVGTTQTIYVSVKAAVNARTSSG